MPTFNDLYYTEIGNKNLKPEYTEQYDAGVVYGREMAPTGKLLPARHTARRLFQ